MKILLETERLYFREFTLDDAEMLFEMHQDSAITMYVGDAVPVGYYRIDKENIDRIYHTSI
jgi:RimJ/RimL family protein N-acetyltransferase